MQNLFQYYNSTISLQINLSIGVLNFNEKKEKLSNKKT